MIIRKIKIGTRLSLGFIILLLFLFTISFLSFYDLTKIGDNLKKLYDHPFMVTNTVRDIKINILNIRRFMLDISLTESTTAILEIEKHINEEEALAYKNYAKVYLLFLGDKTDIDLSFEMFKNWKKLRTESIDAIKNNHKAGYELIVGRNKVYVDELFKSIQTLIDFSSTKAASFYKSTADTQNSISKLLLTLLIVSLSIGIFLAYYITRSITKPLIAVVKNIKEIAVGNIKNIKMPEHSDEMGQLAASYNLMQEDLFQKARVAEQIAKGDFSARIESSGSNDIVANSINLIANNFEAVVKQAKKVAAGNFEEEITDIASTNQLTIAITQMLNSLKEVVAKARQIADGDYSGRLTPKSKSDELALAINQMTDSLRKVTIQNQKQNKIKSAQNELNEKMRGDPSLESLAKNIVTYIAKFSGAQIGAIYLLNDDKSGYQLKGSYAFVHRKGINTVFKDGEGLIGQAALEKEIITFSELPEDYVKISSGTGSALPRFVTAAPLVFEGTTIGVIELGSITEFSDETFEFLNSVMENVAISIMSATNRNEMARVLEITKEQAEELQAQQEELRQSNEELEAQTQALRKSEEFMQSQQEELRTTNEELEEKTRFLERQKVMSEKQNRDLELIQADLEKKAKELEITNKYKSEFLANMSHELRTPLNSLLILSQTLADNKNNNLTSDQIESAKIIFNSGNDLLNLINDILDLSKIESGKMKVTYATLSFNQLKGSIHTYFHHLIESKGLNFNINIDSDLPPTIITDEQRLNQILRNLLSNAIKFTEKGSIDLRIFKPNESENLIRSGLEPANAVAFLVKDTGIGIAPEKQLEIFEAFQQADGSISRKYGGTGLGLSITRELTKLLGGEIKINSEPDKGSEFIVFLPIDAIQKQEAATTSGPNNNNADISSIYPISENNKVPEPLPMVLKNIPSVADDRQSLVPKEKCMLVIDDDNSFAEILVSLCRQKGFKCLATSTGEEGLELAREFIPKGIILDISLPGINGWEVLEKLKNTAETRHIPVHIVSGHEQTIEAFNKGAIGYLTKPVTKEKLEQAFDEMQVFISKTIKDLLIIEDDENLRKSVKILLGGTPDTVITECNTGKNALELIASHHFDCIVLDLGLPDMSGFELLKNLKTNNIKIPPIVVYTGRDITNEENNELHAYTQNIIIKGVKSNERLLDETALFLHRVVDEMPDHQKSMLINLYDKDLVFRNKTILVVDDDMRNVFALTQVLEASKMKVIMAPNGEKALEILQKETNIDLVLMDIMMPIMDGYEAIKRIRKDNRYSKLPIISLTAKAMKEDREKSIAAGANDYLSKPVDVTKLFNLMRIWLYQ